MKKPKDIPVNEFRYDLPENRIAKYPLKERDHSQLLIYEKGTIRKDIFRNLENILDPDTHLIFNSSRVIHARLLFRKESGARIEIFCLEPHTPFNYEMNLSKQKEVTWKCLVGNSKKWKNEPLILEDTEKGLSLYASRAAKESNYELIRFSWDPADKSFSDLLSVFGQTPIPPYLNRNSEEADSLTYQTVYSKSEGSVAAPTAGLHFTGNLLNNLKQKGLKMSELTLHVGAGTFTPVKAENGLDHKMHIERFHISKQELIRLTEYPAPLTSVGTTSCRSLESLYWMGVKLLEGFPPEKANSLDQFEAWELPSRYSKQEALSAILDLLEKRDLNNFFAATGIMISPGYAFRMVDNLITNFHQPGSTLLMLIAAFTGEDWKKIYHYALENNFRFLSYGDSSLLFGGN